MCVCVRVCVCVCVHHVHIHTLVLVLLLDTPARARTRPSTDPSCFGTLHHAGGVNASRAHTPHFMRVQARMRRCALQRFSAHSRAVFRDSARHARAAGCCRAVRRTPVCTRRCALAHACSRAFRPPFQSHLRARCTGSKASACMPPRDSRCNALQRCAACPDYPTARARDMLPLFAVRTWHPTSGSGAAGCFRRRARFARARRPASSPPPPPAGAARAHGRSATAVCRRFVAPRVVRCISRATRLSLPSPLQSFARIQNTFGKTPVTSSWDMAGGNLSRTPVRGGPRGESLGERERERERESY